MKRVFATFTTILLLLALNVSADTWKVDKPHSSFGFSVRHMVVAKIIGNFRDFDGSVEFDGKDLNTGSVDFTVQVASVDTDDEKRDDHLKNADFFDAGLYPTMTFKSTKVTDVNGNNFKLVGILTIKGVPKEVIFDCEFYGSTNDPWGYTRAGFNAKTKINRQDFNIQWSKTLDTGGLMVGNEVEINVEVELVKS